MQAMGLCCLFRKKIISEAKLSHVQYCKRRKESQEGRKTAEPAMENPHSVTEQTSCNTYFNKVNMMKHSPTVHNTAEKLDPAAEISSQTPPLQILAVHIS